MRKGIRTFEQTGLFTPEWRGDVFGVFKNSRVGSGRKENYSSKHVLDEGTNEFELTKQLYSENVKITSVHNSKENWNSLLKTYV